MVVTDVSVQPIGPSSRVKQSKGLKSSKDLFCRVKQRVGFSYSIGSDESAVFNLSSKGSVSVLSVEHWRTDKVQKPSNSTCEDFILIRICPIQYCVLRMLPL
jgi:hypothetical protein